MAVKEYFCVDSAGLGFIKQNVCLPTRDGVWVLLCGTSANFFVWLPVVLKFSRSKTEGEMKIKFVK